MIKVKAHLVNGDLFEMDFDDSDITRLRALQEQGYKGKALIHELITDDWGPPPKVVVITGTMRDGTSVNERLPYD